jgi:chorismate dehydratase
MKTEKLKIGRIPYANFFPIFYYFDNECDSSGYKFVKGVPSKVNKMLRDAELDISPSSSIEFLRNKSKYRILPWFSISSSGYINSILLFSKYPIQELGGKDIALSSESETSTALLRIIFREFLSLKSRFTPVNKRSVKNILASFSAVLYIGDTAMREAKKLSSGTIRESSRQLYIYDLGELWFQYTGLPFVFALWVVRKEAVLKKKDLISKFTSDLKNAKNFARSRLPLIARKSPQKKWLSEKELVEYWKMISYDFTEKHLEGLNLFEKYALKYRIR